MMGLNSHPMFTKFGCVSERELQIFSIAIFISFLAKGIAAFSGAFSVDDILFINTPFDGDVVKAVAFRDGRFLHPLLLDIFWELGVDAQKATTVSFAIYTICLTLTAQLACRLWQIENNFYASLCVVLFATLHPYQSDFLTWRIGTLTAGIPLLLSLYGLWLSAQCRKNVLFGAVAIAAGLNIHQIGISWAGVALCFGLIFAFLREDSRFKDALISAGITRQILAMASGIVLYILSLLMYKLITYPAIDQEGALYSVNGTLLIDQARIFLRLITFNNPFFPATLNLIFLILFIAFLYSCIKSITAFNINRPTKAVYVTSLFIIIFTAIISCAVFPIITLGKEQLFVRTMSALGLFWGGVGAALILLTARESLRKTYFSLMTLICFGFVGINNQIFSEQIRANQRDIELSRQIFDNLVALEDYQYIERIAIIGTTPSSLEGLRFGLDLRTERQPQIGIVMSIFANKYDNQYRVSLLNEALGGKFVGSLGAAELQDAISYCAYSLVANGKFPASGSLVRSGKLGIVCL